MTDAYNRQPRHDIDPVQFGQLIQGMKGVEEAMRQMTARLGDTDERLESLDGRLETVEERFKLGKAGLVGLVIGAGFALYGVKETLFAIWEKL